MKTVALALLLVASAAPGQAGPDSAGGEFSAGSKRC
jgi:hypothetical protein